MDKGKRHLKIYKCLYNVVKWPIKWLFGYTHEKDRLEGPTLVVSNHVTDVDFFFTVLGLNGSHMYFVASEHIFRLGWISKVIDWLVAPIARRKGSTGMDTAMTMMRKLRAGYSVCVFGEGESNWNGRNVPIYPATASLARISGVPLKTFRIEGGHLTMPRWGKGLRRGRIHGHVVNTYLPEQLKAMTPDEINAAINRDIYEDAWERQKTNKVRYRSRKTAQGLETVLFMCPECKKIGTLYSKGRKVHCECGMQRTLNEYGTFEPAAPFENIGQWDDWQLDCLLKGDYEGEKALCDSNMSLSKLADNHVATLETKGDLRLEGDTLSVGDRSFALDKISQLALIQKRKLVMTHEGEYFEICAEKPLCLRKYLVKWQNHAANEQEGES